MNMCVMQMKYSNYAQLMARQEAALSAWAPRLRGIKRDGAKEDAAT